MEKEKFQELQNKAFQAKTQDDWNNIMIEIKESTEGDENARNKLRDYCLKILPKKKEYWEKYPPKEKKQYPIKNSHIFQDSLAEALTEYIRVLTIEKKKQLNIQ